MSRPSHARKEVEQALRHAESQGWKVVAGGGHCWGKMYCPSKDADCRCGEFCITSIWCTPKKPENFARQLKRIVTNCTRGPATTVPSAGEE
ncbi:hypothetical protein [Pseudomonas sp. S31]|uniref:hypothetical protein n=1 Tax=Pseudomonas sp. S31 TaxID=1564473 RepID=UPI001F2AC8E8|nr:hypothetical protein [Pseudomonas sp. S31]